MPPKKEPQLKTREERIKDAIGVLRNLIDAGIPATDTGYIMTKQVLDAWIADGEPRTEKIPFPRAMRVGHLMLPRLAARKITFVLKATDELKERIGAARGQEETS